MIRERNGLTKIFEKRTIREKGRKKETAKKSVTTFGWDVAY